MQSAFSNDSSSRIPILNGDNYKEWKEKILLYLGCMDLDLAIREDEPPIVIATGTHAEKAAYERWERSNRLSLMLIKSHIHKSIKGSIPERHNVKDYLQAIEEQFSTSDKVLAGTLMKKLSSMRYNGTSGIREHIMEMRDISSQLGALEVELSEDFLVHLVLISLPSQFGQFKISYNTKKEKWSMNELLTMCVQEEGRLKQENLESAHLVCQGK
ncbi:uncharacterized protein LOC113304928 [Papaver somniferum]|uniref:uncharacterized protein LOC113304928 n=1 Tax=Papaver somniferum TaxID=3469 RepID=UPI000E6F69EE|nr:uncharacterized protein LOC113304928 [Papaver somniferum]